MKLPRAYVIPKSVPLWKPAHGAALDVSEMDTLHFLRALLLTYRRAEFSGLHREWSAEEMAKLCTQPNSWYTALIFRRPILVLRALRSYHPDKEKRLRAHVMVEGTHRHPVFQKILAEVKALFPSSDDSEYLAEFFWTERRLLRIEKEWGAHDPVPRAEVEAAVRSTPEVLKERMKWIKDDFKRYGLWDA